MSVTRRSAWRVALGLSLLAAGGAAVTATVASAEDPGSPTEVVPVTPFRILDTRTGVGATGPVGDGASIDVQIAGVGTVPANAIGVVLNLTGSQASQSTWVTAWPTGAARPNASVLNLQPGVDSPNNVTALLGTGGKLSLYNDDGTVHLIADVAGYLLPAGTGGQQGPIGPQGPQGPQGPAGPSAALGYEIVDEAGTVGANNDTGVQGVSCPAGKVAVGGGGQANFADGIVLRSSFADGSAEWVVTYTRLDTNENQAVNFTVYAVCINS